MTRQIHTLYCNRLLLASMIFLAGCQGRLPGADQPVPTPVVMGLPQIEISEHIPLTIVDPQDTTQAHWMDHFGGAVALQGDLLVASAPQWGMPPGQGRGSIFTYRLSPGGEWLPEANLFASINNDPAQVDPYFGSVFALQGSLLAVGAPGYDDPWGGENTGAVFLFEYDGAQWVETDVLMPDRVGPAPALGSGVVLDGDRLAISGGPNAGNVYLYQRSGAGWEGIDLVPVPTVSGPLPLVFIDLYGDTLAVSTTTLANTQATPKDEAEALSRLLTTGVVTLFERRGDSWEQTFQTPPHPISLYRMYAGPYGMPISISGSDGQASLLAIGKPGFTGSGREAGSVAIYARGEQGWAMETELMLAPGPLAPGGLPFFKDPVTGLPVDPGAAFFGAWVEFEGDRLGVISTFGNTIHIFSRQAEGWVYQYRAIPQDFMDDFQRRTLHIDGDRLLVGSPGELGRGNVFVFDLEP